MHASEYQEELEIPECDDNCTAHLPKVVHTLVQCDIVIG
jgi:hypothetical protein